MFLRLRSRQIHLLLMQTAGRPHFPSWCSCMAVDFALTQHGSTETLEFVVTWYQCFS